MFETMCGIEIWSFGPPMMFMMAAVIIFPFWFVFSKAGYSKWLAFLMVVPLVNVVLLYFLALAKWPSQESGNTQGHLPPEQ